MRILPGSLRSCTGVMMPSSFIRVAVVQAGLLVLQVLLYFGCECFQSNFHDVKRGIDDRIPFVEWSVLAYVLWFPLIALFPIALFYVNEDAYVFYMSAMFFEVVLSVICYLIYPTTFKRPKPSDKLSGKLMNLVFKGSFRGVNCAPSLHCSSCYLIIFTALMAMPNVIGAISIVVAIAIVISTMTTKQHTFIDVVSALPLFVLCAFIGKLVPFGFILNFIG